MDAAFATSAQPPPPVRLFGLRLDALTLDDAVRRCMSVVDSGGLLEIGMVNAAKLVHMRRDAALRRAVSGCDLILADGQSVVWASRLLRTRLPERVTGIDLFQRLLAEAERGGNRVYFLGARPDVLAAMEATIRRRYPALRIAGSHHGYFTDDEAPAIAEQIAGTGAELIFLGMTSPRKENFVASYGSRTGARLIHGVGGSFDVLAGVVKRAPVGWQRAGMEWLYRALQEPRRLGPRYLTTNTVFIGLVVRELLQRTRAARGNDTR